MEYGTGIAGEKSPITLIMSLRWALECNGLAYNS